VFDTVTPESASRAEPMLVVEHELAETPLALVRARGLTITSNLVLVLSLGIGGFFRFWNINALGYNSDEAVYTGQAAALAGDPALSQFFPIFRAHPMVFQYTLSLLFSLFGVHDILGRSLAAVCGLLTVALVYRIGTELYGPWTGALAAALLALMPYHVVVTRQMLLDGPLTLVTTLTLFLLVRYALTGKPIYLMATGAALGLTFLTKETGFVFAAAVFAFLALTPRIPVRFWTLAGTAVCALVPIAMFPISVALAGRSDTAQSYLVWQLLRPSNHEWSFFLTVVPPAMGWGVIIAALAGFIVLRAERTWRETLLLCWILIPTTVFQIWSVKGFQYLLPIAPAVALLAARTLTRWRPAWPRRVNFAGRWFTAAPAIALCVWLAISSWNVAGFRPTTSQMAGGGGIPGVRETGEWIDLNLPEDAVFMAIGPSMANLIQFYGHRRAYGLSVSANPLNRNPSYLPLINPDAHLRYGDVQYIVFDAFTANRSPFFTQTLMGYVEKYDAREIYAYTMPGEDEFGHPQPVKIIVIYEVRP
jgi:hypothetical protein